MTGAAVRRATVDASEFTEAMTRVACGLAVVTGASGGVPCGLLVSSLCSYSVRPPSMLVCLDQGSRSHDTLVGVGEFGVHVLGEEQQGVAGVFAHRSGDRFADIAWEWDGAVPRLLDTPVYLRCATAAVHPHGDHTVLIGEVVHCYAADGDPLVYYRRDFTWRLRRGS
jgi:flavin reductase ActVB